MLLMPLMLLFFLAELLGETWATLRKLFYGPGRPGPAGYGGVSGFAQHVTRVQAFGAHTRRFRLVKLWGAFPHLPAATGTLTIGKDIARA